MHTIPEIKKLFPNVKEGFENAVEILKSDVTYAESSSVAIKVLKKQVNSYETAFYGLTKILNNSDKLNGQKEKEVGLFFDNLKRAAMALLAQHDRIRNEIA